MERPKTYEDYPCWIVLISNLVSIATYFLGAYIIYRLGIIWMALYIIYILVLELRLMKSACVNCYYYGRYCAFGKGKISSLLFKRGDTHRFNKRKICWKDLVPDFLVTLVPLITGIVLLILDFDWLLLASVIALVVLASAGNGFVRRNLACKFCRQRKLGCPADQLFNRSKK